MQDITEETINYNLEALADYVKNFDFMDYLKARQRVIKTAQAIIMKDNTQEDEFVSKGMSQGVLTTIDDIVQMSYEDYAGKFEKPVV